MYQGINLQQAFRFCLQALLIFIEVSSRAIAPNEMKKNTEGTNETHISNDFPRLSVPHLVLMQQPQTEVEVVCGVQSQLEVKIGWIVFAEDIQLTGNNLTDIENENELFEDDDNIESLSSCQNRRKSHILLPGKHELILKNCLTAKSDNVTSNVDGTQKTVLTFKINQTSECLDEIKMYQESCGNETKILLDGACVANSSAGKTVSRFHLKLSDSYFELDRVTETAHFFGFHRSFWTNSSAQIHKYDREFQKAAGFIVGMCCPIIILLYMSFYLTCFKNSGGNHDANMFGSDRM